MPSASIEGLHVRFDGVNGPPELHLPALDFAQPVLPGGELLLEALVLFGGDLQLGIVPLLVLIVVLAAAAEAAIMPAPLSISRLSIGYSPWG